MSAVNRRVPCLICALMVFLCVSTNSTADREAPDFYTWIESEPGRSASLAQMKQQCDDVRDPEKNLKCSVSVLARMFEDKAANQLPDYYLAIKRRHAGAIANDPELKPLFSMFGSESLATLRQVADFSVTQTKHHEVLPIHPYPSDGQSTDEVLPYIDVKAANGVSARFILDTGAPQTRVNTETAKLMGIRLLTDSHYGYSTFYGERDLAAQLGILESLKIGAREFRNVLVFVSDRDNLLGLDLIGKSGRLKVTKKTLEINAAPPTRCDSPITYARMDFNQRLTIAARLDRRATLAIIDTGNVDYLTSSSPGHSPDNVTPSHRTYRGELSLAGRIRSITYKYYPDYTIPPSMLLGQYVPSILLGWGAFNDYELNLDIASGLSCFNRV
ncbi:retropepsin-like aspartic protease [Pseudomonas migulae]|uniref:Aspartyl protease n=1 Tax=Pseudomonas migulae TaxID=78543 RepID=A0A1H5N9U1_9PSED|nr:retropepsin-like aspartic protease [Pseudomonas migulae]SEE98274.1 Aspartyl protease [Pseudomonas migulae]